MTRPIRHTRGHAVRLFASQSHSQIVRVADLARRDGGQGAAAGPTRIRHELSRRRSQSDGGTATAR